MDQEKEKSAVKNLQTLVKDLDNDGLTYFDLLRWLQTYEFDFDKTLPLLRAHLRLMNSWNYKNHEPNEIVEKYWPCGMLGPNTGIDDSQLVYMECTGSIDMEGLAKTVSSTEFYRARVHKIEQSMAALRKQEENLGKQCKLLLIYDFQNMEYSKDAMNVATGRLKAFSNYFATHYPSVICKFVAINMTGYLLSYPADLLRPLFPTKLNASSLFLGQNFRDQIFDVVDKAVLPESMGGTRQVDVSTLVNIPESKIPQELYWNASKAKYAYEDSSTLEVKAGTVKYVDVEVTVPNSTIEWYFTINRGWGFGVYFTENVEETDSDNMEMVFPEFAQYQLPTSVPENDKLICKKVGYYKLKFNNSHAWLATLTVRYKIVIS